MDLLKRWRGEYMCELQNLGKLCEISTGNNNRDEASNTGKYPFFVRSKDVLAIDNYSYDENAVIIPGEGAVGDVFHYVNGKYGLHQRAYRIHPYTSNLNCKYLYYYLFCHFKSYIIKKTVGATSLSIRKPMLEQFVVVVPDITTQEEIVKILDSFTNLIDALNEELSLRQKQFEYYREKLLTFDDNHYSISSVTMDDLFNFKNGYTPSTKNSEYWTNGEVNWFTVADFKKNNNVLYDSIKKVSISAVKGGKLFKPNSILLATTATIGIHALIRTEHLSNQQLTNLSLKKEYVDKIDIKYIYYYMFLIDEWCKKNYHGGGFMIVDMVGLKKQQIPIPSLSIQQSIVEKLDAFESLISSLKEEIALRQKQYEYYREKLLTFD